MRGCGPRYLRILDRIFQALLFGLIFLAPLAFGSVYPWAYRVVEAACFGLGGGGALRAIRGGGLAFSGSGGLGGSFLGGGGGGGLTEATITGTVR